MKNSVDKKKLAVIILPIVATALLLLVFFSGNTGTKMTDEQKTVHNHLLLPDAKEEDIPETKVEAYKNDDLQKIQIKREQEESIIKSSDFFKEVENVDEKESATQGELSVIYESTVASPSSQQKKQTSESLDEKGRNWHSVVADKDRGENKIDKLYEQATSSVIKEPVASKNDEKKEVIIKEAEEYTAKTEDGKRIRTRNNRKTAGKNMILACIHGDQTVSSGSSVRLRLLEDIEINGTTVQRNTLLYGVATIGSERMDINVENIKFENFITPVKYQIYDNDAIRGLNLPDNIKQELARKTRETAIENIDVSTVTPSSGGIIGGAITSGTNAVKSVLKKEENQIKVSLKSNYKIFITEKQ